MIKELFYAQLLKEVNAPRKKYNIESIKPSSIGSKCLRKLYYEYFKVDPDKKFETEDALNFFQGNMIHSAIQEVLERTGNFVMWIDHKGEETHEFVMKCPELAIKYSKIDGVLYINDKVWLLEIKSVKSSKFYDRVMTWREPATEALMQGTVYHFGFEENFKHGKYKHIKALQNWNGEIAGVRYLYVCKDDFEMREFAVSRNSKLFREIAGKCFEIIECGRKNKLPPKKAHFCKWCDYQKKCKNNWNLKG